MRGMDGYQKGVNLGGWLSQVDNPSKEHYDTFITEENIKEIASWGLDHVRVPVDYDLIEEDDGTVKEDGYKYIDNCVAWCQKYNINMIIDLHKTYGYSFDPLDNTDKRKFFYDEELQEHFYALWRTIAKRYEKYSDMLAYELLNEILFPDVAEAWNNIALKAVSEIRKYAPNSWVIFGGTRYNAVISVPELPMTDDKKVCYTFHCYEPMIFTHQGAYWVNNMPLDFRTSYPKSIDEYRKEATFLDQELAGAIYEDGVKEIGVEFFESLFQPAIKTAEERDIALYCGEYGVIDRAAPKDMINWLRDINTVFTKYSIGRALWNYKEKDYGIHGERCSSMINEITDLM